jgi:hypothetical protein
LTPSRRRVSGRPTAPAPRTVSPRAPTRSSTSTVSRTREAGASGPEQPYGPRCHRASTAPACRMWCWVPPRGSRVPPRPATSLAGVIEPLPAIAGVNHQWWRGTAARGAAEARLPSAVAAQPGDFQRERHQLELVLRLVSAALSRTDGRHWVLATQRQQSRLVPNFAIVAASWTWRCCRSRSPGKRLDCPALGRA